MSFVASDGMLILRHHPLAKVTEMINIRTFVDFLFQLIDHVAKDATV